MYFSKVTVASGHPEQFMALLKADDYALHQWLWQLFPDQPQAPRDFLFRHDEEKRWPVFYLLSRREPDPGHGLLQVESKPYHPRLATGETLSFSLRANAVHTRKVDDANPKKRKRDDVVMHLKRQYKLSVSAPDDMPSEAELAQEAGEAWIARQGENHGFQVLSVRADNYSQARLNAKGRKIRYSSLDFVGLLRVTQPETFTETLFKGIGPAKAFGCGLLLVRRV